MNRYDTGVISHIVQLHTDGRTEDINELSFRNIHAADVDDKDRLYIAADDRFYRIEANGVITELVPEFTPSKRTMGFLGMGNTNIAVSPNGTLYCISSDHNDSIQVWTVDKDGKVNFLPLAFNRAWFGDVYQVGGAGIDVGDDGRLAIIVTAKGSRGQGPCYQRVCRADADGTNLKQIANLDSERTGGMVDIAVGPNNDVFVSTAQNASDGIHRINGDNIVSEFVIFSTGRDPKSIDVDPEGNVWVCTTVGVFRAKRSR